MSVCALASLLLTACVSPPPPSPPSRYFSLSPTVPISENERGDAVALGIGPIRVPDYLERSQMVTREAGQELYVQTDVRWAEPLSRALHRIVAADVDNAVDGLVVVAFPWEPAIGAELDFRVVADVRQFEAYQTGRVILDVQWTVTNLESTEMVVRPHNSRYETRASSPGDPESVASAMNEAVGKFSRDIASEMQALLAQ